MPLYGTCKTCGHETENYCCWRCRLKEANQRADAAEARAAKMREALEFTLQQWQEHGFHESRKDFDAAAERIKAALDDAKGGE